MWFSSSVAEFVLVVVVPKSPDTIRFLFMGLVYKVKLTKPVIKERLEAVRRAKSTHISRSVKRSNCRKFIIIIVTIKLKHVKFAKFAMKLQLENK